MWYNIKIQIFSVTKHTLNNRIDTKTRITQAGPRKLGPRVSCSSFPII